MILKKIEMYGFKSFADRVHIQFGQGITAIVGPNGSGKSNVADAVRWVLGEQSAKSLRGTKMEDIIFNGTQVRKSLGFAEVSLTFDNTQGKLSLEYSEITITRRVFRSGESEYYINRSACRLKDIVELFMDTGVGKEGYSIIGQGRIDEILSTRSEDRRYIFEEAAGIVKYKTRREEAEKKLQKTQDNLMRVEDILAELEIQLLPLEEQSKTAREYLKLKEQLKFYEINQFLHQYQRHTAKINELKEQINTCEEELCNRQDANIQKEAAKEQLGRKLHHLQQSIDDIKKQRFEFLNDAEKRKGDLNVCFEKIKQYERDNLRLIKELEEEKDESDQKRKQWDEMKAGAAARGGTLAGFRAILAQYLEKLTAIEQELGTHQERINETKDDIVEVLNGIAESRNHITRYKTIEGNFQSRQSQIEALTLNKADEKGQLTSTEIEVVEKLGILTTQKDEKLKKKSKLDTQVRDFKLKLTALDQSLQRDKQQLEGRKSRLKLLEDMKQGYEGFQKSVKEVLLACKSNSEVSHKVCGAVASLINVPGEFELAIETALGPSLQHIVTEQEEDAKYLIGFLRKHNYGRATFLPISSIRGRSLNHNEQGVLNMQGCCGIASHLVTCDSKYRSILDNLLGRVVIAENLDSAVEMARRFTYGFRIVTLEGDVLNPGGSMTGGSSGVKGISILGRNREIRELREEVIAREQALRRDQQQQETLGATYRRDKETLEALEQEIRSLEIGEAAEKEKCSRIRMSIIQVEKEIQAHDLEKNNITKSLEELWETITQTEANLQVLEQKNQDIQASAQQYEQSMRDRLNEKEEQARKAADMRVEIASAEVELQAIDTQMQKLKVEVDRHTRVIGLKEGQIHQNTQEISSLQTSIAETEQCISDMEKKAQLLQQAIVSEEDKKDKSELELSTLEREMKEWGQSIHEFTDRKYRLEVQLSRFEVELENYQNNIWQEYEITYANAEKFHDFSLSPTQTGQHIQTLKKEISSLGEVNVNAIDEYKRIHERFNFLSEQKNDLMTAKEDLREIIRDITKTMEDRFKQEFAIINRYFNETFSELFRGGNAQLVLDNKEDVLSCGIEIIAQPPGKKLQSLSLLSGGERALTAIAILFAILKHKPTPFCVLDEIDAALDESNVQNFSRFVKAFSQNTQFVIITHRKGTMEVCDMLYGIVMEEKGVSRMISVKFDEMVS